MWRWRNIVGSIGKFITHPRMDEGCGAALAAESGGAFSTFGLIGRALRRRVRSRRPAYAILHKVQQIFGTWTPRVPRAVREQTARSRAINASAGQGIARPDPSRVENDGPGLATTHRGRARHDRIQHSKNTERHSVLSVHAHTRKGTAMSTITRRSILTVPSWSLLDTGLVR